MENNINSLKINSQKLFRLPWTISDNAMTWLEPTRQCNITCDACFHNNDPTSSKTLKQIEIEMKTMMHLRKCDAMLIAGGEPLTHPNIVEITKMVKSYGVKPMIMTNGVGLDKTLVHELKKTGMIGFNFHIDSHQDRPGWEDKNEEELNELRQFFAEMLWIEGGLFCAYNTTIYPDTLKYVPIIVDWAKKNIDKVHTLSIIAVRMFHRNDPYDYYAGKNRVDLEVTPYLSPNQYKHLSSIDIYNEIIKSLPEYKFCSYLGGTAVPTSLKWVIGIHIGTRKRSYGNMSAKSMELLQYFYHFFKGRYFAFSKPNLNRKAKLMLFFGLFDKEIRKTLKRYWFSVLKKPTLLLKKLHAQCIMVTQPVDILPTGELNHCDGCPNKTYWDGRLVSACRLEEYLIYGGPISFIPKVDAKRINVRNLK